MEQSDRKKQIYFDRNALKEYQKLSQLVRYYFDELIEELEIEGYLLEPDAKKIKGTELYEIRVKHETSWRCFYAYLNKTEIIVLSFFQKQTRKTPKNELSKALKRYHEHIHT